MRWARLAFNWLAFVATVLILAHSSSFIRADQWPQLLAYSLIIAFSGRLTFTMVSGGALDFVAGAVMMAFVGSGPSVAFWALAIGTTIECLIRTGSLLSLVLNLSYLTVSAWAGFATYGLLTGWAGSPVDHLIPSLLMAAAFMLANVGLYTTYLIVNRQISPGKALRQMLDGAATQAYIIVMLVGLLAGFAYVTGNWLWSGLVVGLAYMLHRTLAQYFTKVEEARSQTRQLEVVLNATQGALIMTDRDGMVKVANRQAGVLFGIDSESLIGRSEASLPQLRREASAGENESLVQQVIELTRGPIRFAHWYRAEVHNKQGETQGHIEVFTDVTPLKEAEENQRSLYDSMIRALTAAIDARDSYTHGHSARVSAYAVALAGQMGLSEQDRERIRYSGLLHDIGKLGIDDRVLRKHGSLIPNERALMMQHPVIGAEVLHRANVLTDLIPGVRHHHEWFSGGGYPDGLTGAQIPRDARIIGVADALDAMTSDRPYRPAMTRTEALNRIRNSSGTQFDPAVVEALGALVDADALGLGEVASTVAPSEQSAGMIRPVHGKELSILYQLSREDFSMLSLDAMLHRYLETFSESLGPHVYLVYLMEPDSGSLVLQAGVGVSDLQRAQARDLRTVRDALSTRTAQVVDDVNLQGAYVTAGRSRTDVAIPLIVQEEVLGALVVEAAMPGFFDRDDLYLLEALVHRLASAVKLVRYHERLAFAATHDGLTNVSNHRYFYERLTEEVARATRYSHSVSVMLLDINGLKAINDTYGHLAGDEALREYARILKLRVRVHDIVARYGGDEFAVIMPEISRAEAIMAAHRLIKELAVDFSFQDQSIRLPGAAWGVGTFPDDGTRPTELVLAADKALYRDKAGKERSHVRHSAGD